MKRIWIYQSSRRLNEEESKRLMTKMEEFTAQWKAHGKQLTAEALLKYNQFLILCIDEGMARATGCSIDKSVHLLQEIQEELNVDFFDRMNIAYRDADGIKVVPKKEFERLMEIGEVNENTIVFNNTVNTYEEFETLWEVPLKSSWQDRKSTRLNSSH